MAGILSGIGQAASGVLDKAKEKWKAMPREQKKEFLTTLGATAAAAFSKPKKVGTISDAGSINVGSLSGFPQGRGPEMPSFSSAPVGQAEPSGKFARKMRKNFGR
jgi:hypothetical protein